MTAMDLYAQELVDINNKLLIIVSKLSEVAVTDTSAVYKWQDLIGSIMGGLLGIFGAVFAWWIATKHSQQIQDTEFLEFVQNSLNDQLLSVDDLINNLKNFIKGKVDSLLEKNTFKDNNNVYDLAFFPLMASRPIAGDLNKKSTGSGYIDSKLTRINGMSHDLPFILQDLQRQFEATLTTNKELVLRNADAAERSVSPAILRQNYLIQLKEYRKAVVEEMLEKNLPLYESLLVECAIAVKELRSMGAKKWRKKFTLSQNAESNFKNIDDYIKPQIDSYYKQKEVRANK